MAFLDNAQPPPGAPDAYLLHELTAATLFASIGRTDEEVSDPNTTGCISDMCDNKPDMAIKLRSGFLCTKCRNDAAKSDVSGAYLDAIQALLDRARFLALGRVPQAEPPPLPSLDNDSHYIETCSVPRDFALPPLLRNAFRLGNVTVLVGSGLSLQEVVEVVGIILNGPLFQLGLTFRAGWYSGSPINEAKR